MNRVKVLTFFKSAVIVFGGLSFAFAVFNLDSKIISWSFLLLTVCTLTVAPRMSLNLPRSNYALSFSDSVIFLTFLLFGGEAAIILASLEVIVSCLFLKTKGFGTFTPSVILLNFAVTAVSTTISYFVWIFAPAFLALSPTSSNTTSLI